MRADSLTSIFSRDDAASSSSFSSYDVHAGWMTFAENGGFLMALLVAHFISSRVHRRVTRAHRLADSLPWTRILKNSEFDLCLYITKIWILEFDEVKYAERRIRIKQKTQTNYSIFF